MTEVWFSHLFTCLIFLFFKGNLLHGYPHKDRLELTRECSLFIRFDIYRYLFKLEDRTLCMMLLWSLLERLISFCSSCLPELKITHGFPTWSGNNGKAVENREETSFLVLKVLEFLSLVWKSKEWSCTSKQDFLRI